MVPEFKAAWSVKDFAVMTPAPPRLPEVFEAFGAIKITPPAVAETWLLMAMLFDEVSVILPPVDVSDWLMTMLPPVDVALTSPPAVAAPSNEMLPGEFAVSRPEAVSVEDVVIVLLLSVIFEPVNCAYWLLHWS